MPKYLALVPAAGSGARFGAATPKQYLPLLERPLIHYAVAALCAHPKIDQVAVVVSPQDEWWESFDWRGSSDKLLVYRCGGMTRAESVRNGLKALGLMVSEGDWVLVHDAARPCLTGALIDALIETVGDDPVGGILATPLADTLKRANLDGRIVETVPREQLWQAQTPQMFRAGLLKRALDECLSVTDEASAVESLGLQPRLVASDTRNFKVTLPPDLAMAEKILRERL